MPAWDYWGAWLPALQLERAATSETVLQPKPRWLKWRDSRSESLPPGGAHPEAMEPSPQSVQSMHRETSFAVRSAKARTSPGISRLRRQALLAAMQTATIRL